MLAASGDVGDDREKASPMLESYRKPSVRSSVRWLVLNWSLGARKPTTSSNGTPAFCRGQGWSAASVPVGWGPRRSRKTPTRHSLPTRLVCCEPAGAALGSARRRAHLVQPRPHAGDVLLRVCIILHSAGGELVATRVDLLDTLGLGVGDGDKPPAGGPGPAAGGVSRASWVGQARPLAVCAAPAAHVAGILQPFGLVWRSVIFRMQGWVVTETASSLLICAGGRQERVGVAHWGRLGCLRTSWPGRRPLLLHQDTTR